MRRSASASASICTCSTIRCSSFSVIGACGLIAAHGAIRGGALDQLAGDADHRRGRPACPPSLAPRQRPRAVRHDRIDVADGARLHVGQPLALPPGATHRSDQPPLLVRRDRPPAPWRTRCRRRAPPAPAGRRPTCRATDPAEAFDEAPAARSCTVSRSRCAASASSASRARLAQGLVQAGERPCHPPGQAPRGRRRRPRSAAPPRARSRPRRTPRRRGRGWRRRQDRRPVRARRQRPPRSVPSSPRRSSASTRSAARVGIGVALDDDLRLTRLLRTRPGPPQRRACAWRCVALGRLLRLAHPGLAAPRSAPGPVLRRAQQLGRGVQRLEPRGDQLIGRRAAHGLDAAQPGADARLAGDPEGADLPGGRHVRAAAQLGAVAVDAAPPGPLSGRTSRRRTCRRRSPAPRPATSRSASTAGVAPNLVVHPTLDLAQRLARRGRVRREVEAQPIRPDPAAGLLGLLAEDVAQRAMQQVRGGVVAGRRPAPLLVYAGRDLSPAASVALQLADVDDRVAHPLRVLDHEPPSLADQLAAVADLAAALRVERASGRARPGPSRRPSASQQDRQPIGRRLVRIADELASQPSTPGIGANRPARAPRERSRCSAMAASNPSRSTAHAALRGDLDGQVDREAEGVVQPERLVAGDRAVRRRPPRPAPPAARSPPPACGRTCASSPSTAARISSRCSTSFG